MTDADPKDDLAEGPHAARWEEREIPSSQVHDEGPQPVMEHLVQLIAQTLRGERQQDIRHMPVRNLVTRDEDVVAEHLVLLRANPLPPPRAPLFVVEVGQRRYWAFDDTHSVRAWQETTPEMMVAVDVLQRYESSAGR